MKYPLIKGGQGRTAEDLTNTAVVLIWMAGMCFAFAICALIWKVAV